MRFSPARQREFPLLRLDLKDLEAPKPVPVRRHLGLAAVTFAGLLATYTLLNGLPAASNPDAGAQPVPFASSEFVGPLQAVRIALPMMPLAEPAGDAGMQPPVMAISAAQLEEILPPAPQVLPPLVTETPGKSPAESAFEPPAKATPRVEAPAAQLAARMPNPHPELRGNPSPEVAPEVAAEMPDAARDNAWRMAKVQPGDTLSILFERHGLDVQDAYQVAELEAAAALSKIKPGEVIRLAANADGGLATLRYRADALTTLQVVRADDALHAELIQHTPRTEVRSAKISIWTNLFDSAQTAGIDYRVIYELARIFQWQVDFNKEIRVGDQLSLIFEEQYLDGTRVGHGNILAAELRTAKHHLRAVRHVDENGRAAYYAPNGDGLERSMFLRSPLKFSRVTSHFSHRRFHPIHKKWMPHRGVDYGAPRGTPVHATADGVVKRAAKLRGYGRTVELRHGNTHTTLYAHLHRFGKGVKRGRNVQQGDIIGYVGSTGWATGPHLHYEFRENGKHKNPLTVKLQKTEPIADAAKPQFLARAADLTARLDEISVFSVAQLGF